MAGQENTRQKGGGQKVARRGGATGNLAVLPVRLLSFGATQQQNEVLVKWWVSGASDAAQFVVEKSVDGRNFTPVGQVAATATQTAFAWTDKTISNATVFYRLKIVEKNGSTHYSAVVSVGPNRVVSSVTVSPNPARGYLVVDGNFAGEPHLFLTLTDALGRTVFTKRLVHGRNEKVSLSALPQGRYYANIAGRDRQLFGKAIFVGN